LPDQGGVRDISTSLGKQSCEFTLNGERYQMSKKVLPSGKVRPSIEHRGNPPQPSIEPDTTVPEEMMDEVAEAFVERLWGEPVHNEAELKRLLDDVIMEVKL
jgi:hypothetical protein